MKTASRHWVGVGMLVGALLIPGVARTEEKNPPRLSAAEKKLLDLVNQARTKRNREPLPANAVLCAVARAHSANMVRHGEMAHVLDGKDVFDRLDRAGYDWASGAENLATKKKDDTLEEVLDGWLQSKGHRENLLQSKFREVGVGLATDARGKTYCTLVFGRQRKKKG